MRGLKKMQKKIFFTMALYDIPKVFSYLLNEGIEKNANFFFFMVAFFLIHIKTNICLLSPPVIEHIAGAEFFFNPLIK